jgi:hypothetical protein
MGMQRRRHSLSVSSMMASPAVFFLLDCRRRNTVVVIVAADRWRFTAVIVLYLLLERSINGDIAWSKI